MLRSEEWMSLGLCRGLTELFYLDRSESGLEAKRVCRRCPVQAECLEYALKHNEVYGVWGGTSGNDREKIKRWRRS